MTDIEQTPPQTIPLEAFEAHANAPHRNSPTHWIRATQIGVPTLMPIEPSDKAARRSYNAGAHQLKLRLRMAAVNGYLYGLLTPKEPKP